MAALQSIRSKAGLLVTVLGVALLAFILGDFFSSGTTFLNRAQDKAFTVDGTTVPTKEYVDRYTQMEEHIKMMYNRSSLDEATTSQIREEVYQSMVKEMMLNDQAEKLGLTVTPEELADMVYGANISPMLQRNPIFSNPETGAFNREGLINFLSLVNRDIDEAADDEKAMIYNAKSIWLVLEKQIKLQRLDEKYNTLAASTFLVNDSEIKAYQEDIKQDASLTYVVKSYQSVSDSLVNVTDTDIIALYNKRKNNYQLTDELRKVSYFIKDVIPSTEDNNMVKDEMTKAATRLAEATTPESVVNDYSDNRYYDAFISRAALNPTVKNFVNTSKVGDILGPVRENETFGVYKIIDKNVSSDSINFQIIRFPQDIDMTAINTIADSLHTVIKNGKSFAAVANELDPQSNGGEAGMFPEMAWVMSGMPKECINATVGSVIKTKVMGQPLLVRVNSKSKPIERVKLASIEMKVVVSDKTQNMINNELAQFINESGSLDKFNEGANNQGYSLVEDAILHPSMQNIEQIPATRHIIHWAFNEKVGTVKKFDLTDKRIVAIVTKAIKEEYLPMEEVKDELKAELVIDKKAEQIISDLKSKNLSSIDSYASAIDSQVGEVKFVNFQTNQIQNVGGYEPVINAYAKLGENGSISEPMKGFAGVYVMGITEKKDAADRTASDIKSRLQQNNQYTLMAGASAALTTKMDVKDNRIKFW